ncbi:MAG: hypothetical protein OEX04_05110 [Acidimicrobiia bacterium]|nr:hypothetical protein [Acidimicrobiia bacterium]MDH4306838.1 hypothetical protein [Acidimicrobiia bacterium]MDH5294692.1 hypothetical protein [Acidimicrobiia bacterium]
MGTDGPGGAAGLGVRLIARVVPAVPTFAVDDGFRYAVPERLAAKIGLGSMVRVPLGGRRVGGFVVDVDDGDPTGLKPIASISGSAPVFDQATLEVMRWAAGYYVAPLSVMLGRCAPPNVPRKSSRPSVGEPGEASHPLVDVILRHAHRTTVWLDAQPAHSWIGPVGRALRREGKSLLVVVPTGEEVQRIASGLGEEGVIAVDHEMNDAEVTDAWSVAAHRGGVVVGTPRVAMWPVSGLGAVAAVEESRRAMKDRQTPTVHARELLLRRAATSVVPALFGGPAPSLELVARAPELLRGAGRIWPLVEVVDRREEPPGGGLLTDRAKQALRACVRAGGRAFVFAHRRGYSAASRCVKCRTLRTCPGCGSRPDPQPDCRRCGAALGPCASCGGGRFEPLGAGVGRLVDEIRRFETGVGEYPSEDSIQVGTERDLTTLESRDLVVMVDMDGLMFGVDYRATEEAFRIGTRLASKVARGSGRRLLVQTSDPEHRVIASLRRGDPGAFHAAELEVRRGLGYPPFSSIVLIEIRDGDTAGFDAQVRTLIGAAEVMGPAPSRHGTRWLIQGQDLTQTKRQLRAVVQRARDSGATVRIDVDPIEL